MGGDSSATDGCRQQQKARYLTVTPSAAGRLPPPLRSVSSRLLDFYHECVDNGGWARVLYDARDGLEKLTIIRRIQPTPAPSTAAPPATRKPGRQASARRRECDKRRREAWAERRTHRSQPSLHTPATDEISATAEPATSSQAAPAANTLLSPASPPTPPQPAPPSPVPPPPSLSKSPQQALPSPVTPSLPAPPPRKRAKTVSEATWSSSRAAVVAKKRQIPQLDGCFSPPISPPQPASRSLAPLALANSPPSPVQQPTSSLPGPDTTEPAPNPAPEPAPQPPSSPAGLPTPAPTTSSAASPPTTSPPSLNSAAETLSSNSPGYTLVLKLCPNCNNNLINSRDFECHACQDCRYYCSLDDDEE
jgi:hypothetical protein